MGIIYVKKDCESFSITNINTDINELFFIHYTLRSLKRKLQNYRRFRYEKKILLKNEKRTKWKESI